MYIFCIYLVLFLYCKTSSALSNHPKIDDNPETREKFAQFYCYKLKTCTPGGDKVCGFDDTQTFLAEFEDLCTLYKVNCEKKGLFHLVDAPICEGQKKYLSETRDFDNFDMDNLKNSSLIN